MWKLEPINVMYGKFGVCSRAHGSEQKGNVTRTMQFNARDESEDTNSRRTKPRKLCMGIKHNMSYSAYRSI